jgi:hypothetical protein
MSYNYIQSQYATEKSSRIYISKMFTTIYSVIDKIFKEAETDIIKAKYEDESKEIIIEKIELRINNLLSKFEDLLFQFNYKFKQTIDVPLELFSYQDKIEYLSKLQPTSASEIDVNAVD